MCLVGTVRTSFGRLNSSGTDSLNPQDAALVVLDVLEACEIEA